MLGKIDELVKVSSLISSAALESNIVKKIGVILGFLNPGFL